MNKYLHTVASVGFLFTLNYDARNHELKIHFFFFVLKLSPCLECRLASFGYFPGVLFSKSIAKYLPADPVLDLGRLRSSGRLHNLLSNHFIFEWLDS